MSGRGAANSLAVQEEAPEDFHLGLGGGLTSSFVRTPAPPPRIGSLPALRLRAGLRSVLLRQCSPRAR